MQETHLANQADSEAHMIRKHKEERILFSLFSLWLLNHKTVFLNISSSVGLFIMYIWHFGRFNSFLLQGWRV